MDFDCLVICNSNLEFSILKGLRITSAIFVSTHQFYDYEKAIIDSFFKEVKFICFSDFYDDEVLSSIDNLVKEGLQYSYNYVSLYQDRVTFLKNELVYKKLTKKYHWGKCIFTPGLGVSENFWSKFGKPIFKADKLNILEKISLKLRYNKKSNTKNKAFLLKCGNINYIFLHEPKRLNIKDEYKPKFKIIEFNGVSDLHQVINRVDGDVIFCTTIHMYKNVYSGVASRIYIFLDGFHPSNYPFSYMGQYQDAIFIYKDHIGKKWLDNLGLESIESPDFISKEYLSENIKTTSIQSVCLLMNHAGDWSALINRSDTDILISKFVKVASEFKNLIFIIRLHPTAIHENHEGRHAFERVRKFINSSTLKNLRMSEQSLEDDLDDYDLFISEYSNTLINVFKIGKLGIICNLTKRRSFMIDYENLGFTSSNSVERLCDEVSFAVSNTLNACQKQIDAVKKYNSYF